MDTLEAHIKAQPTLSDSSNVWSHKGKAYFYEIGTEHADGAITGQIHAMDGNSSPSTFRIEANGTIARFPYTVKA